jgi:energy-coupling factor transport system ATP-binding protein
VEAALRRYRLEDLAERNPFRLSGGQKRRLSLAAIEVTRPVLLLADEPAFGQDRISAYEVMDALREAAGQGSAVLFSSHEPRLVAEFASRVLVMDGGRVVADVSPAAFFSDDGLVGRAAASVPPLVRWWLAAGRPATLSGVMAAGRLPLPC